MIKSTQSSLKFSNINKQSDIQILIDEYRSLVSSYVDILWDIEKIPTLLPKEMISQVDSWMTVRMKQCAGKQASGIVRGTQKKQKQRKWRQNKLVEEGKFKQARKLQRFIDEVSVTKSKIDNVCPELDSRFIKFDLDNETSFDGWINITSIGNKMKIKIPFKKTKHFNKLFTRGKLKSGIRLSNQKVTFMFELPEVDKREEGSTVGIDVGQTTVLSLSNGIVSNVNNHNHDLASITKLMKRKKKGSKSFLKTQQHRKNYINWTVNQLNLDGVKEVKIEDIKNMRKGNKTSRSLSHWTYTEIFSKINDYCNEQGVLVQKVNPTYTSKRCNSCGWTRSNNRQGKLFKCKSCGHSTDADLNASKNIAANLKPIWFKKRLKLNIKTGFFWLENGQAPIVPVVQKT